MSLETFQTSKAPGLVRGLGVWAATAVVVGSMIGQSVFLVASDMAREVDSMWKVLVVWIICGVIVLFGALCYAELGAAMPEAGGDYIYLGRGIGPLWGFLFWLDRFHDYEARDASSHRCWDFSFRGVSRAVREHTDFRLESSRSTPK